MREEEEERRLRLVKHVPYTNAARTWLNTWRYIGMSDESLATVCARAEAIARTTGQLYVRVGRKHLEQASDDLYSAQRKAGGDA